MKMAGTRATFPSKLGAQNVLEMSLQTDKQRVSKLKVSGLTHYDF
jgi:hypothetical protein